MKGILAYSDEPLVSSDLKGDAHSSIFSAIDTLVHRRQPGQGRGVVRQRVGLLGARRRPGPLFSDEGLAEGEQWPSVMSVINANKPLNRTKIVATIGPASRTPEVLRKLIEAGVNVFRLNFSHGTHEEHSAILADIRALSREVGHHVAVLQDLCGPKIRLGPIAGDVVECPLGEEFTLVSASSSSDSRELTCSYRELPNDLKPGETILFADGTVAMTVTDTEPGRARLKVTLPGRLRSRQGLNLPGSELAVQSLTDKDLHDLDWTARHADDVEFVGLSFVRSPEDIARLRRELQARQCPAWVVVKIEKPQAVRHLEEIVAATDCVMVARGDLGVEMDVHRVPAIQKRIIALCNRAARPVITATQMLNSMEHSSRPTRAEASDVFNAVLDGTDAVMLVRRERCRRVPRRSSRTLCARFAQRLKDTLRQGAGRRSANRSLLRN